jgi:hypothetical protein
LISHPIGDLAAVPETAIRRRLAQSQLQLLQKLRLEHRGRAAIVATKIAQRLGTQRVVAGKQFLDPARHKAGQLRHFHDRVTLGQQPDRLVMPRRARIRARPITLLQLRNAQMIHHMRHGRPPAIHGVQT